MEERKPKEVRIGVGLVGTGLVAKALVNQIAREARALREKQNLDLQVIGITNTRRWMFSEAGLDLEKWSEDWQSKSDPADLSNFLKSISSCGGFHKVLIDCSPSDTLPDLYNDWILSGGHVVTPNKKLGAGPLARYQKLQESSRKTGAYFLGESTVGAGLPVLSTLRSLLETGDQIHRIEGIFSGTLSYIFNNLSGSESFSSIVAKAKEEGFTEPDPREDLSGMDVARKVVILARQCGLLVELDQVPIDSLVPEELRSEESAGDFLKNLEKFDDRIQSKMVAAEADGEVLRYVGVVDIVNRTCEVALKRYPSGHAFANVSGTDNVIQFTTLRYSSTPLVIQGPGAGADVTAMGVFSDLLMIGHLLGTPL